MTAPTQTFNYVDVLRGSSGNYTVSPNSKTSPVIQDYSDNANDNLTQLGDITNDRFNITIGVNTVAAVYKGQTQNGSIVAYIPSFNASYLVTNRNYAGNTAVQSTSSTHAIVCYISGTLIRASSAGAIVEKAVEDLAVGDLVVTASGEHRPIRWLGHRTIDCQKHPRPTEVMPVRISAHAFGANKPARDLFVSPGHAICVDVVGEVLIPACALVNGTTIQQVEMDTVTYWHVELDSHDILLAENLPAESYLEMGNRSFFWESDVTTLDASPDARIDTATRTHAGFCRPFHGQGSFVDVVRSQLRAKALAMGWTLDTSDPFASLHLVADGSRIDPVLRGETARFSVPAGARDIWLMSTTSRPCEISDSEDDRNLGVCVRALTIVDGFGIEHDIDLSDPLLCVGFHRFEEREWRWTAGQARLPAALWASQPDSFFLRIGLAGPALPRWIAPAEALTENRPDAPRFALVAAA